MRRYGVRSYAIAGIVAMIMGFGLVQMVVAEPDAPKAGTTEEAQALLDTFHRFERIYFDATITGDPSLFPTIFYNDPSIEILPEYQEMAEARRTELDRLFPAFGSIGPVGGDTGYLSAKTAEILIYYEQVQAWDDVKAAAARENRNPSIQALPEGLQPIERRTADEWVDSDTHIHDAVIQGDHATATFSFGTEKKEGTLLHLTFTQVDGRWFISSSWSSGDA